MKAATAKRPSSKKATEKAPKKSRRSQQRLIALRMGLNSGTIQAEELREECRRIGVYDAPNFKQDMKKESVLFNPVVKDGKTIAWKLTSVGKKVAKQAPDPPGKAASKAKAEKTPAAKAKGRSARVKTEKPKASEETPEPAAAN